MSNTVAVIAGCASAGALIINSLRTRGDTELMRFRTRVLELEAESDKTDTRHKTTVTALEAQRDAADRRANSYQLQLLAERRNVFTLRNVLAEHGWPDPTLPPPLP